MNRFPGHGMGGWGVKKVMKHLSFSIIDLTIKVKQARVIQT